MFVDHPVLLNGRYLIRQQLGEGGMGTVYHALDRLTGREVALKRVALSPADLTFNSHSADSSPSIALAREFQALASLRHPHIITVLDYGFDTQGLPFFTMDLLDNARDIVTATRDLDILGRVHLLTQTLQALSYLHRHGIVHRDLKPGNVVVTNDQVRVLDFGLSIEANKSTHAAGTLAYMAPELLSGHPASVASDLFSFGILACEVLGGRNPFHGDSQSEILDLLLYMPINVSDFVSDQALADVLNKLLHRSPEVRYPDARAVITALGEATGQPIPMETPATRESYLQAARFTGRGMELQMLIEALTNTVNRQGSAFLIGGESGVGKTRLVNEIRIRAQTRGAITLRGHSVAQGGLSYQAWRGVVPQLALIVNPSDLEAAVLKEIAPDLPSLLERPIPDAPELEGRAAGQRLANTIVDLFRRLTRPTLLILEDLHWAFESIDVLRLLLTAVPDLPLLIVGTYREEEAPGLPGTLSGARAVRLDRLNRDEIASLSRAMLGLSAQQEALIDLLERETEGNAYFLVEVIRALGEERDISAADDEISLPARIMAGGVQRILERRLAFAPRYGHKLLWLAALAGRELDLRLLEATNQRYGLLTGDHIIEDWLVGCIEAAVLDLRDGIWRFAHDKLRDTLIATIPTEEQATLHRYLAEGIEALYSDQRESQASALAFHWHEAGEEAKEAGYAALAGKQLMLVGSSSQALEHLNRALAIYQAHPDLAAEIGTIGLMRLRLSAIDAMFSVGQWEPAYAALETLRYEAEALEDSARDRELMAAILCEESSALALKSRFEDAANVARRALDIARSASDSTNEVTAFRSLGAALNRHGQTAVARDVLTEAATLCRQIGSRRDLAAILLELCRSLSDLGEFDAAEAHGLEALNIAQADGDRGREATAYNELGVICGRRGDALASKLYYQESYQINRLLGLKPAMGVALANQGVASKKLGEYAEAESLYRQALDIFNELGHQTGRAVMSLNLGNVYEKLDRDLDARRSIARGLKIAVEIDARGLIPAGLSDMARVERKGEQYQRAVQLLTLALSLPNVISNTRQEIAEQLDALKEAFSEDEIARIQASVSPDDLDRVIAEITDDAV